MKKEEMETLTNTIQQKIGKEASALIADDIGKLITDNSLMNSQMAQKDEQISKLKEQKENLIETNGNLLQQVSMGKEEIDEPKQKEDQKPKVIDYRTFFDEKRKF